MSTILSQNAIQTLSNAEPYNMSDKYTAIQTIDVINKFEDLGFNLINYEESRYRKAEKQHKIRHVVRLGIDEDQEVRREIIIMNSTDGSSGFKLHLGIHRFSCANGLIACDDLIQSENIRHNTVDPWDRISKWTDMMKAKLNEEQEIREAMYNYRMSAYDMEQFAYEAIKLRELDIDEVLDPMALNIVNRPEDAGKNLWKTYNRIQENLLKGNYQKAGTYTEPETNIVHKKWKAAKIITAQDKLITINKKLHSMAYKIIT